jgi:diketogulonate reductase-like aldo/keto reductase
VNLRVTDPSETPGRRFDAQLTALAAAREEGLIDGIGLSNVSRRQLLRAVAQTEIVCVQNLFNLADQRSRDVLTECEARHIAFVPFCPLGWPGEVRRRLLADPVLAELAARLGATPVQVALAWLLDPPEHPADPGNPHPRPPRPEPRRRRRPARRRGPRRADPSFPTAQEASP